MLEEIILNMQSEKQSNLKNPSKNPLRKSMLLFQSQDVGSIQNKSLSFFFNTLDEDKISINKIFIWENVLMCLK